VVPMKSLEVALNEIKKAIETITDEETKRKALEEFERLPKDPASYKIVSPAIAGINFPATTDKEIIYEDYAKKLGISMLEYYSNAPGIYVEIKGNNRTQRLSATDLKKGEYTTFANETTPNNAFDITVYNANGDVLDHLNIEKQDMMLDYNYTIERTEKPQLYKKEVAINARDIRYIDSYRIGGTPGFKNQFSLTVDHRVSDNHAVMHYEGKRKIYTPGTQSNQEIYEFRFYIIDGKNHLMVTTSTRRHYFDSNLEEKFTKASERKIYNNNVLTNQFKSEEKSIKKDKKVFIRETQIKTNDDGKSFTKVTETRLGDRASNIVEEVGPLEKGQRLDLAMTGEVVRSTNDLDELLEGIQRYKKTLKSPK
jgi:hypothetical protein